MSGEEPRRRPLIALLYAAIVAVAVWRVAMTHRLFSAVLDEPAHIAAGFDWLRGADYRLDVSHPPLARVLSALPLWIRGLKPSEHPHFMHRGNDLLYHGDRYVDHLAMTRLGNLVLMAIGIVCVGLYARLMFGEPVGIVAAGLYSLVPSVLGHGGLATTDNAVAAMFPLAGWLVAAWLRQPTYSRALAAGVALGLGALAKFSFVPFGLILVVLTVTLHLTRRYAFPRVATIGVVIVATIATIWAGYRFEFGTMAAAHDTGRVLMQLLPPPSIRPATIWFSEHVPVPAPLYLVGMGTVAAHDHVGHRTYLLGRYGQHGWWYYFPVILFYKTPVALLALIGWGIAAICMTRSRDGAFVVLLAAALLLFVMRSSINIGIRHILPLYTPLSIIAAYGAVTTWRSAVYLFSRAAMTALFGWLAASGAIAHPDYLAYFNEAAGAEPERIAVDSNLDWGQDVLRLADFVKRNGVEEMSVVIATSAQLDRHGIRATPLKPYEEVKGWVAASATQVTLAGGPHERGQPYRWLNRYKPVARVGRSIKIYRIE